MATTKFDPFRKQGGTIELVRDANTGAYSTKTVGFASVPVINLPQLGVVEVTDDAATTKKKADEALKTQTSAAFQSGGGGEPNRFLLPVDDDDGKKFSDLITQTSIENQEAQEKAAGIGVEPIKTPEIRTSTTIQDSMPRERKTTDDDIFVGDEMAFDQRTTKTDTSIVPSRNDLTTGQIRQLDRGGRVTVNGRTFTKGEINKATIDRGAAFTDDRFGEFGSTVGTTPIAGEFAGTGPDRGDQTLGIRADPTTATGAAAVTQSQGPFDPRFRDQAASLGISAEPSDTRLAKEADFASGIPERRNIFEKAIDSFKDGSVSLKIAKTGLMIGGQIATAIGDKILGVTAVDVRRRELDTAAAKSLGFKTRGELGASTDPGRIAFSPADHVLGGKNRDAALGNLSESGAKRIQKRMTTGLAAVEKRYGKDSQRVKDYKEKTKTFQRQMNEFNTEKEKKRKEQAQNPNLRSGAGKEGGGTSGKSIVCTAMYQTTGLQDWAKAMKIWYIYQKRYLTLQHQEGYHKLFKPFVKGMHKSDIIKAIGAHFAKHRTQHLKHVLFNSKPSLLGKVYSKVLESICYWAGKK
tara:strand:+ start:249 stop:1985 length:1737 start_codon:yes stop_codon:yes gene_type:complete